MTWQDEYSAKIMKSAALPSRELVRGEGCYVWDDTGAKYLDFLAGIAVNALGHAHPVLVDAVSRQIATVAHVSNYFANPPQLELAARLTRLTGGDRVYFCNSGAEAIEAAIKLARRTGRPRIIALNNSFHGRTMGSLSLTGKPALREPFEPLVPNVEHIDSTIEALERAIGPDVAAVVIEPIKGEAGVIDLPEGYLAAARDITARHGALLILDEIQTGAGRTGTWWAFQQAGIVPDAIAVAKGIGGGVPIGALVTFGAASDLFTAGQHGSTFGGNPLACAAGLAVVETIESDGLLAHARAMGEHLVVAVDAVGHPLVDGVRGEGLLRAIALTRPVAPAAMTAAREAGFLVNAVAPDALRLAPPLVVTAEELDTFVAALPGILDAAGAGE